MVCFLWIQKCSPNYKFFCPSPSLTHPPPALRPPPIQVKVPGRSSGGDRPCAAPRSARVPVFLKHRKCRKERTEFSWSQRPPIFAFSPSFPPPPSPQHRLLIFKSTAIAWCGFKSWGAILPDDDSADVNGILIVPSATSETSPLRLLLFTEAGLSVKRGTDFWSERDSLLFSSKSSARRLSSGWQLAS